MRQRLGSIVPLAAALLLGAATAQAQAPQQAAWPPGPGDERSRAHGPQGALTRTLELSEAQQEKLREIMDEQRPQLEALHEKISANRDALHQMLESGSADANAVGELVLEGRRLHEQSRALREAGQKAIRGVLTPEQQKKFDTMQAQRRERGPGRSPEGWPGDRPPFGPGPGARGPRPPQGQAKPDQPPLQ
jgi:Spy/CpxP family protein refolding chaperone